MPCKHATRREFLRDAGCGVFTIAALGLSADAVALPVTMAAGAVSATERSYPIPQADGVTIDRKSQVILVRFQSKAFAMALACPHENAAVKWLAKDHRFQCSKHDSEYTPQGTYTTGHTTRNLDRFPIRRDGTSLVVTVDRVYRSDQNLPAWTNASVDLTG